MAAVLARSSLVSPLSLAFSPMEPDTSMTSSTRAPLRCSAHRSRTRASTGGAGTPEHVLGLVGVDAVGPLDRGADGDGGVAGPEPELQDPALVVGLLEVALEDPGRLLLLLRHPRRVEDDDRVVGEERPFLGVDGHQGDPGLAGDLARIGDAVRVAGVVVDDRLLLDGDRRGVGQPGAPLVVLVEVVHERQGDVAVVDDRRLHGPGEGVDLGPGQVLGRQVTGLVGGRVVLGDGGREGAGREVGVGLAEPERAPLRVALAAPAGRVLGQLQDVGVADRRGRPAQRLGHGPGHGDDQRRAHERAAMRAPGPAARRPRASG